MSDARKALVTVLNRGGLWYRAGGAPAPIAVWVAKGAANLAASYVNLVNPGTHDLTSGSAPTLQAAGWLANSTAYIVTDIVPSLLTYTIICRISGQDDASKVFMGTQTAASQNMYIRNAGTNQSQHVNGGQGIYTAGGYRAAGVFAMAGKAAYIDGVAKGVIPVGGTDPTHPFFLMGLSVAGSPSTRMSQGHLQAVAIYDSVANHGSWVPSVSAAMAAL